MPTKPPGYHTILKNFLSTMKNVLTTVVKKKIATGFRPLRAVLLFSSTQSPPYDTMAKYIRARGFAERRCVIGRYIMLLTDWRMQSRTCIHKVHQKQMTFF